ncbi:ATP-binding protein [Bacteroides sp. 51]|uniref:PAS domain-containing hybrid sensor histidine kinase/response regulator n=1 Tax=Bacteroides sp. 51 TaxID=2302938 RepID=UPI0013D06427|nr:ATP-binding protein [Bacteroides sp. 51]NDV82350.1 response regulator [Bacteroides sp. 51]
MESSSFFSSTPFIAMLSAGKNGIWEYNIASDELEFANDFFQILNLDAVGICFDSMQQLYSLIHPEDLPLFNSSFKMVSETDEANSSVKYRLVHSQGKTVWLKSYFYSYHKAERIISLTRNIQKQEEEKAVLCKENNDYRNLLKAIPDFVFIFDKNLIFQDIILPEGLNLFHNKEEIIGQNGRIIYSEEVSQLFLDNIKECLETGQLKEIEYPVDLFGTRYYYKARITPLEGEKAFVLISDISDRIKRMENLLEARLLAEKADRMKSAFIANMSHEIRTPLNSIIGFSDIIATEEDPKLREEYLEIVHTNNTLLLQLVNDILDFTQIESGKYEMSFTQVNIHNLISEIERIYQTKIKPGIEFKVIYPDISLMVLTDANRVKQVVFNFLSNAVKNTFRGSITLGVEERGGYLYFYVSDTGAGIPKDKLKTIFNRFEKLNNFAQGTGLGLSISENLVEHLGGEINVESRLGVGSTFSFTLPYEKELSDAQPSIGNELKNGASPKILVTEDSESRFEVINEILEKNYQVVWAKNRDTAIRSFILEKPDFVLINIQLEGMNGIDAMKKIRDISSTVPIVGITSSNFYMEQRWAMESGCNEVIAYPFSASKLKEVVLSYI